MIPALLPSEVQRVRHVRSPRELGAVIDDVEARLGRPLTVADCDEVTDARLGHPVIQVPRTATFERRLPGWGGAGALYHLAPALLTVCGEAVAYAIAIVHEPEHAVSRYGRPGEITITLHPATKCGATHGGARFAGSPPRDAVTVAEAFRQYGYDVVELQAEGTAA